MIGDDDKAVADFEKKKSELGAEAFAEALRNIYLETVDLFWMDHLEMMDYLRSSVNLRAYGQRDPLVEYKKEGLKLFKEMEQSIINTVIEALPALKSGMNAVEAQPVIEIHPSVDTFASSSNDSKEVKKTPVSNEEKVGRNDPCPCGSGKKYKHCHGK
jgi:preprotein translocase subunit SecA